MNRYLSTVGLYAGWNLYKILAIILITALAAGALVYCYPIGTVVLDENYVSAETGQTTQLVASYPKLEGAVSGSYAPVVCAAGFAAIAAVMSLTGCGYNTRAGYTVQRLRVKEETAVLLWVGYHAVLLVIFWALLAAVLYGVMRLRLQIDVPMDDFMYTYGPQSMMLLCYTDTFLHHLLPLQDVAVWGVSVAGVLATAFSSVAFSYYQRREKFSIFILLSVAATVLSFFCPMGDDKNFILMAVLLGIAGAAFVSTMRRGKNET